MFFKKKNKTFISLQITVKQNQGGCFPKWKYLVQLS